jgi:peroxiredoxin
MTIAVGESLPNVKFMLVTADGPKPVQSKDYFAGKTIVLFGLPGAFTPTCHKNHLPGFIANEAAFKGKGVDAIAMTAVNDVFVLGAWQEATGAKGRIDFLADGGAAFAKAVGLDTDLTERGLGIRSKRYSMYVVDGVVKELNIEPELGKTDLSGAEHILGQIK